MCNAKMLTYLAGETETVFVATLIERVGVGEVQLALN
jgi:hypothetical protein